MDGTRCDGMVEWTELDGTGQYKWDGMGRPGQDRTGLCRMGRNVCRMSQDGMRWTE